MIPLFRRLIWAFFYDEAAAKRWLRGTMLWASTMLMQVLAFPWVTVSQWTVEEWGWRLAASGIAGAAGTIIGGEKNPSPEQIRAMAQGGKP